MLSIHVHVCTGGGERHSDLEMGTACPNSQIQNSFSLPPQPKRKKKEMHCASGACVRVRMCIMLVGCYFLWAGSSASTTKGPPCVRMQHCILPRGLWKISHPPFSSFSPN